MQQQQEMATVSSVEYRTGEIPVQQTAVQASDRQYSLRAIRAEAEIAAISRTLKGTGWNRRLAARLLSISYRGLLYKIRQHQITRD